MRTRLDRLQHALEINDGWSVNQEVEAILSRMSLEPDANVSDLSAGMKRRVLLARALVASPDILLLDEPTNHLDIGRDPLARRVPAALQCDDSLRHPRPGPACASWRRASSNSIAAGLTSWSCDYETYLQRKEAALEAEARQRAEFDKKLAREEVWIRTGIQARRTRNEGRVRALREAAERPQPPAATSRARCAWRFKRRNGPAGW